MRLIDADALIEQMEEDMEHMEEPLAKMFTGAAISDIKHAPTVEAPDINVGNIDTISRQEAKDIFTELYGISAIGSVFDKYEWADICETTANELPSIQPERKGVRLSTVCLLCKKPAVSFNTEDDIPYTNYSYCEDCLRKGLKLLKEQKKNLQAQPERKMGHWICESQWSDTMGTNWNTWKCDQCNVVAAKGWEHTRDGMKPNGKFCSECGAPMDKNVIFINITEKE